MTSISGQCPQATLDDLALKLTGDGTVTDIDGVLSDYPHDARLHFLKGSVLAGDRRYEAAMTAMGQAVEIAPGYEIARFQLGFLQFTSGDTVAAGQTWAPFGDLADGQAFKLFSEGLMLLVVDDAAGAIAILERGMAQNLDYPALNTDLALLVAELKRKTQPPTAEATSETDMLLWQFGQGSRH